MIDFDKAVSADVLARAKKIKCVVFDVDGVMTDGGLGIGDDGQEYKNFHSLDGLGMKLLKASGVEMAIITGRTSKVVTKRAESTGIAHFYQGVENKLEAFNDLLHKMSLQADEVLLVDHYMGKQGVDAIRQFVRAPESPPHPCTSPPSRRKYPEQMY